MLHLRSFAFKGGNFVSLDEQASPPLPIGPTWQRIVVSVDITKPGGRLNVYVGGAGNRARASSSTTWSSVA